MKKSSYCLLVLTFYLKTSQAIDGQIFAKELDKVAVTVGMKKMQEVFDGLPYKKSTVSGSVLVQQITEALNNKFTSMENAVNQIKTVIESTYSSFSHATTMTECCEAGNYTFNTKFRTKVAFNESCYAISSSASENYKIPTSALLKVFQDNYAKNPNLLWQYFGGTDGVYVNYPATKLSNCDNYDPRFRPYFASAATPKNKDIVVVIDTSNSMSGSFDQKNLLQFAKEAAITVINTLNPEDRVGIVAFNDVAYTPENKPCFKDQLAFATYRNIDVLKTYINSRGLSGKTNYEKALITAFTYFHSSLKSISGEFRDRVILFLSDGENAAGRNPLEVIKEENEKLNNSVVINTYGLSIELKQTGKELLQNMSKQVLNNNNVFEIIVGQSNYITNPGKLRSSMGSYYLYFSSERSTDAVFSKPYVDLFSDTGLLLSMCLPVNVLGDLVGVACTDIKLSQLTSDVTYFQRGDYSYAFMIDGYGTALVHPLLPQLRERKDNSDVVGIENFEISNNIGTVLDSMKMGEAGVKVLTTRHIVSRGIMLEEGVTITYPSAQYSWSKVGNSNFSVCVVTANISSQKELDNIPPTTDTFMYHNRAVYPGPYKNCKHFTRFATVEKSAVMLTPSAFLDPDKYLDEKETESIIRRYEQYFNGQITSNPGFKDFVKSDVAATSELDSVWIQKNITDKYLIWRYVCTVHGVVRMFPGVQVIKKYDHKLRPWYIRSLGNKGINVISAPYLDLWSSGYLITLSKAIYKGNSNGQHTSSDEAAAVMGTDFPINYFHQRLNSNYWQCESPTYSCMVVDSSGIIVMHPHFVETSDPGLNHLVHITSKEGAIAKDLMQQGLLYRLFCLDVENQKQQYTYRLSLLDENSGGINRTTEAGYELSPVPGSNIFIILKLNNFLSESCCSSPEISPDEFQCSGKQCDCLCYTLEEEFNTCENKYTSRELSQPCSPRINILETVSDSESDKIKGLPTCYDTKCSCRSSKYDCYNAAGCSWCEEDHFQDLLPKPFCGLKEMCPLSKCVNENCEATCAENNQNNGQGQQGSNVGVIMGVVFGLIALIAIITLITFFIFKWRKQESQDDPYLDAIPEGESTSRGHVNPVATSSENGLANNKSIGQRYRENLEIPKTPPPKYEMDTISDQGSDASYHQIPDHALNSF